MQKPFSRRPADVTWWLAEGRESHVSLARHVRHVAESALTLHPRLRAYIASHRECDGCDSFSSSCRMARRVLLNLLKEVLDTQPWEGCWPIFRWFVSARRDRMLGQLLDLWFADEGQLDAAQTRAQNAYTVRIETPDPQTDGASEGVQRTLEAGAFSIPECVGERTLSALPAGRQDTGGDVR